MLRNALMTGLRVIPPLLLLLCSAAQAQDQVQRQIAQKIVQAFPGTEIVPCPEKYERAFRLGKSVCLLDPRRSSADLIKDIRTRFKDNLISLDAFRFVAWKGDTRIYPIRQYNFLPQVFISVQDGVPTATPPALPRDYRPTRQAALGAGATSGATYAALDDLKQFLSVTRRGPDVYLNLRGHTLRVRSGTRNATLDGKPTTLTGQPFTLQSTLYLPVSGLRPFGCQLQDTFGQVESGYMKVSCPTSTGGTKTHTFATWRF